MNDVWNLPEDGEEEIPEPEESPEEVRESDRFLPSEQRAAVASTRRAEEERRQNEEPFEGEEKRQEPERRSEEERRSITYDLTCATSGSLAEMEDWLDDHCEGQWNVVLEGLDDDLVKKKLRVMFEFEEERENFFRKYIKGEE